MKDFALDENSDILIENKDIVYVRDKEQEIQKIRQVIGTKIGEWKYDENEGVDFEAFSQKNINVQRIRETIQNSLREICESYVLQDCIIETADNILYIKVLAENQDSLEVYIPVNTKE